MFHRNRKRNDCLRPGRITNGEIEHHQDSFRQDMGKAAAGQESLGSANRSAAHAAGVRSGEFRMGHQVLGGASGRSDPAHRFHHLLRARADSGRFRRAIAAHLFVGKEGTSPLGECEPDRHHSFVHLPLPALRQAGKGIRNQDPQAWQMGSLSHRLRLPAEVDRWLSPPI